MPGVHIGGKADVEITSEDSDYISSRVNGLLYDVAEPEFKDNLPELLQATQKVIQALNAQDGIKAIVTDVSYEVDGLFNITISALDIRMDLKDDTHGVTVKSHFDHSGEFEGGVRFFVCVEDGCTALYRTDYYDGSGSRDKKSKMNFDTEDGKVAFFDFIAKEIVKRKKAQQFKKAQLDAVNPTINAVSKMPPQNKFKI
jgi:hypothetical protein